MSPDFLTELLLMQQHSQCAGAWETLSDINDFFSSSEQLSATIQDAAAKVLINHKQNGGTMKYLLIVTF